MPKQKYCAGCNAVLNRYNTTFQCGSCAKAGPRALIPENIWQQPQIRAALSRHDFGRVSAVIREQTPLTQRQIAEMVGLDQSGLSRIETTKQRVTHTDLFFRFVQGLGIPLELVVPPGLTLNSSAEEEDSVKRRYFLTGTAGLSPLVALSASSTENKNAIRIGISETQALRHALNDLSALDDQVGGERLWRLALWQHNLVQAALENGRFDNRTESELLDISGDVRRSIGWLSFDSSNHQQANRYFGEALNLGYMNDNPFLVARIIANMTRRTIELRKGRETVRLAQKASRYSGNKVTPRIRCIFALREAQGWAINGDKKECEDALTRAHNEFDRGPSERDPDWVFAYMNQEQLAWQTGMARSDLRQYASAEKLLETSAHQHSESFRRNLGICLVRLSTNSLSMGEMEKAAFHAKRAAELADKLTSARVAIALTDVRDKLFPHHKIPVIRDALEHLHIG